MLIFLDDTNYKLIEEMNCSMAACHFIGQRSQPEYPLLQFIHVRPHAAAAEVLAREVMRGLRYQPKLLKRLYCEQPDYLDKRALLAQNLNGKDCFLYMRGGKLAALLYLEKGQASVGLLPEQCFLHFILLDRQVAKRIPYCLLCLLNYIWTRRLCLRLYLAIPRAFRDLKNLIERCRSFFQLGPDDLAKADADVAAFFRDLRYHKAAFFHPLRNPNFHLRKPVYLYGALNPHYNLFRPELIRATALGSIRNRLQAAKEAVC